MCTRPIKLRPTSEVPQTVPCGICVECRSRHARGWAIRCMHEASLHEENCFATVTYADEYLPEHGSLVPEHLRLFWRRLRRSLSGKKVKYYAAGEYGETNFRPHYHFLLFGHRFLPTVAVREGPFPLFRSDELEELWSFGLSSVGELSFASASYVARYVMKKVDEVGRKRKWSVDPETGESHEIVPEFSRMSRGGREGRGIGAGWFDQYGEEVARLETVRMDGAELQPPRYYDELMRKQDEKQYEVMKLRREVAALVRLRKSGYQRMTEERMAREVIAKSRLAELERSI